MPVFEYTAQDEAGNLFAGTYNDIDSTAILRDELTKMGYTLVKARRKKQNKNSRRKVHRAEVVTFAYKFAGMCAAGLSIMRCLEALEEQAENPAFKNVITDIKQQIETGASLKNAFGKYRAIFSDFFVGMLEAGESGGKLAYALDMAAAYLEKQQNLKRKVKSAFAYPIVVSVMCFLIVTYLVICVVPVFSKIYAQLGVALPGPTQALINISIIAKRWWWLILILLGGGIPLALKCSKIPEVKVRIDSFKLKMPVFGPLNRMVAVSQFCRTFAMLSSAGVTFLNAIEVAKQVVNNYVFSQIGADLQKNVEAGLPLAESMVNHRVFPAMIVQLTAAGEEAGILPEMLNKGIDFLDNDIGRTIDSLLIKLEPALTLIMGSIVGFILMGVYLPMFDYMSHLK
ncbi:MAG: type II secretion system F family protein [Planctomycetota bacterium]